jgi:hypothetical protein
MDLTLRNGEVLCVYQRQELELKKVHFDVAFPPGEIDF